MARAARREVTRPDVVLALVAGVLTALAIVAFPRGTHDLIPLDDAGQLALTALGAALLVVRRTRPLLSTLGVAATALLVPGTPLLFVSLYAAGVYARPRGLLWVLVPLGCAASFAGQRGWIGFRFNDHALAVVIAVLVTLAGLYVGTRRALLATARERAERAEREQHLRAEAARAEERAHLAAEMHDVVTHRVTLMVLRAGALGVDTADPAVRAAAEELRCSGVQALAELRDLLGVLRSGGDPAEAAGRAGGPAAADTEPIATLVEESRAAGVEVDLDERGDPAVLAPALRRTVHRAVQESLTNARKHAPGAAVRVVLRHDGQGARVEVVNRAAPPDPRGPTAGALAATGSGTGLAALRRRVEMVGGSLDAGPAADGGFAVRATFPAPTASAPAS